MNESGAARGTLLRSYVGQQDRPILQFVNVLIRMSYRTFLPKNFMGVQHCSFCDASQGKNHVFICHFVYADRFPIVFWILIKSMHAEAQPVAPLMNREWQ